VLASGAYGDEMIRLLRPLPHRSSNRRIAFLALTLLGLVVVLGLPAAALAGTAPTVSTSDAFSTSSTTATVEGVINPGNDSTTYAVQWDVASSTWCMSGGSSGSPGNTTPTATVGPDNNFDFVSVDLSGLTGGTDYCAQLTATNADGGPVDGGQVSWTQGLPEAITTEASPTGTTTATIAGTVNPTGQSTTYAVQYDLNSSTWCQNFGTSGSPAHQTGGTLLPFSDNNSHDVSVGLTGLTAGTHYCAQLIATNGSGEGDGGTVDWTQPVSLTVSRAGSGSGMVRSSPLGIDCGATCSTTFPAGTLVLLTAIPDPGSTFSGWSGGGCSGIGVCKTTLNANTTVTATFTIALPPTLTVLLAGTGSGSVTSSPAGIDCGATCTQAFTLGTRVTLTATPAPDSAFSGWSGGGCSGTGTCVVTLNGDTTVTANFQSSPPPPTKCIVPKVKGKKLAAAKRSIKSHHCSVGKITRVKSSPKNRGHVISQSPKPGKHLRKGAKVALKVGK
jgi:PASTA domain/Divergent InlB B-repeat domain